MSSYTKTERETINAAFAAILEVCERTNWSDNSRLNDALKLERRETGNITNGRAMVIKAWFEGVSSPDKPLSKCYWIRPGYLGALMLGVSHAIERLPDDYTGPKVRDAIALAPAAIEANNAHTTRICNPERAA